MNLFLMFALMIAMFASLGLAVPGTWYGYVTIDGTTASDGTIVEAFVNSETTAAASETLERGDGYYIINVPAKVGDNITFKVYGVTVNEAVQNWSLGVHLLNLTMNKTATGTACTYAGGCTSGYCVDGYCCDTACSGTCNKCNVSGSEGTCTDVNSECAGTNSACYCSDGSCVACAGTDSSCYCSSYACVACASNKKCSDYSCVAKTTGGGGGGGATSTTTTIEQSQAEKDLEEGKLTSTEITNAHNSGVSSRKITNAILDAIEDYFGDNENGYTPLELLDIIETYFNL